jgi:membrane protease YdiL (CAAX protease family)
MLKKLKVSYLASGILFLMLAYVGGRYRNWGQEAFAFLLLIYLVVIIGIKLDELSCRLTEIQAQLTQQQEHRKHQ